MYRSKSKSAVKSASKSSSREGLPAEVVEPVHPMTSSVDSNKAQTLISCKAHFTAPFMIYDPSSRTIVSNPKYDRTTVSELARIQSIMLHVLRQAVRRSSSYTPKELLFELERAVLYVCASTAVPEDTAPLRCITNDGEVDPQVPVLENFFAQRSACAKVVTALAYTLTQGIASEELKAFISHVRQRIAEEEAPTLERHRKPAERQALQATRNNLDDFVWLHTDLCTAFQAIETDSQTLRKQPQNPAQVPSILSSNVNVKAAELLERSYYTLLNWLLTVDQDRRALQHQAASPAYVPREESPGERGTPDAISSPAHSRVVDYDPLTGSITLERPSFTARWGLLVNQRGYLIGIENELRNATPAGERLYRALQQEPSSSSGGLPVLEVGRFRIRPSSFSNEATEQQAAILSKMKEYLGRESKSLQIVVGKRTATEVSVSREALFELCTSSSDGEEGTRAVLMLQRAAADVPWGLTITTNRSSGAILKAISPDLQISDPARSFLSKHCGRLRILQINYRDTLILHDGTHLRQALSDVTLLALQLQVVAGADAFAKPEEELGSAEAAVVNPAEREKCLELSSDATRTAIKEQPSGCIPKVEVVAPTKELPSISTPPNSVASQTERQPLQLDYSHSGKNDGALKHDTAVINEDEDWTQPNVDQRGTVDAGAVEHVEDTLRNAAFEEQEAFPDVPLPSDQEDMDGEAVDELSEPKHAIPKDTDTDADAVDAAVAAVLASMRADVPVPGESDRSVVDGERQEGRTAVEEKRRTRKGRKEKVTGTGVLAQPEADSLLPEKTEVTSAASAVSLKTIAQQQGVLETPLMELKSTTEWAKDVHDAPSPDSNTAPKTDNLRGGENTLSGADAESGSPVTEKKDTTSEHVAVADLVEASPLLFSNQVTMEHFDGATMEFCRGSTDQPWNIKVAFIGPEVVITKLPPFSKEAHGHPYLRSLHADSDGNIRWAVDGLNGKDLSLMNKDMKAKALEAIKKSTKLTFALRALRK